MISAAYAARDMRELQRVSRWAAFGILATSGPTGLFLLVFGRQFMLIFGPEFANGTNALTVLVLGNCVAAIAGGSLFLLAMTDKQWHVAFWTTAGMAACLILGLALVPRFGVLGAAVAYAVSFPGMHIAMGVAVVAKLRLNPFILGRPRSYLF
jgi:O-antigen/teichoic acid export membrane protein